jgi:hypothetical protein
MRWQLTFTIALATLPAVVVAQQEQSPRSQTEQPTYHQQGQGVGDSLSAPQDTSRNATQQVDTTVSAGEVSTDSTHQMKSDTTTNQTESGVVNKKGKSTLGPNIKKVKPTQGKHLKEPYKKGARAKSDTTQGVSDTTAAPSASDSTRRTQTSTGEVSGSASDSMQNQTQSGVEDSSGASTLGPNVKKVRPTQGAAVTSKGDTLRQGGDTTSGGGRSSSDSTGSGSSSTQPPR